MGKDITLQAESQRLLEELQRLLEGSRWAFRQERTYHRAVALLVAELLTVGRHTVTQLLRSLGVDEGDWSGWYRLFSRPRFVEERLGGQLVGETVQHGAEDRAYVTTLDGVVIPRSGAQVAGSSWWRGQKTAPFCRGLQRGQRFVEVAWLTPAENSYCRAVPLRWLPAVTAKATPSVAPPCKEWEAGVAGLRWLRAELDSQGHRGQWLVAITDGKYDVQGIWEELPERTTLMVRTARNRKLFALAGPPQGPRGPGRPTLYGERLPTPADFLQQRKGKSWLHLNLLVRGQPRPLEYQLCGPCLLEGVPDCPLFLIVVRGKSYITGRRKRRTHYRKPYFMLVNAVWRDGAWQLPFSVDRLLFWAWQRWECEVAHREMKSALGIGEKQCWSRQAALSSVQWGVWVYGLCVLAAYRTWGLSGGPRRRGAWYRHPRRWSFTTMWQAYRSALWGQAGFSPLCTGTLTKWLKPELWMTTPGLPLTDPGRI